MDETLLDNPVWHALGGPHQRFSLTMGEARRYLPDIAPFAAVATPTAERLEDVARFVSGGDVAAVLSIDPIEAPRGTEIASTAVVLQMIARRFGRWAARWPQSSRSRRRTCQRCRPWSS